MTKAELTKSTGLPASIGTGAIGEIAAAAFVCFDRGVAPDEVVTELVLPVETVEHLWRSWARLRGIVPLSAEAARAVREALRCNRQLANGSDIVDAVRLFLNRPIRPCPRCKNAAREYCTTCPGKEATRAARGSARGTTKKKARDQNNRAGLGPGTQTVSVPERGAISDIAPDAARNDLWNGPRREPGEGAP